LACFAENRRAQVAEFEKHIGPAALKDLATKLRAETEKAAQYAPFFRLAASSTF
jgi:hypothetical protein